MTRTAERIRPCGCYLLLDGRRYGNRNNILGLLEVCEHANTTDATSREPRYCTWCRCWYRGLRHLHPIRRAIARWTRRTT